LALAQMSDGQSPGLELHDPLAGDYDARQALDALAGAGVDGPILLVGHEPDLSGVVGDLAGGRVDLKKGGLAVVRLAGAGGELVLLLRPAELALIAGVVLL
jgi:phosphohistidine phosphatase